MNGFSIKTKVNMLTGLCLVVALTGTLVLLWRMQAHTERNQAARASYLRQMELARVLQLEFKKQVQEWKDILLRGHNAEDFEEYRGAFSKHEGLVQERGKALSGALTQPSIRAKVDEFLKAHEELGRRYRGALRVFEQSGRLDYQSADRLVRGMDRRPTDLIDEIVGSIGNDYSYSTTFDNAVLLHDQRYTAWAILIVFLGLMGASILIGRRITRPIFNLAQTMAKVSTGKDYSLRAVRSSRDELGLLADGFNEMLVQVQQQNAALQQSRDDLQGRVVEYARAEEALRASEDRYRSLVEESPDMIGIFHEGKLVFINSAGTQLLGAKTKDELLGRRGEQLIHPDDLEAAGDRIRRRLAGETGIYPTEVRYVRLDGTTLPVDVSATPITFGGAAAVQFIARNITERKRAAQRLRAQYATTKVLAESATLAEATPKILQAICESLEWEVSGLWVLDPAAEVLRHEQTWHVPAVVMEEFEAASRRIVFTRGVGLIGRVWAEARPIWVADAANDGNFQRAPHAARAGLHGAFAFPIKFGDAVLGVLEVLSREAHQPDEQTLEMLAAVGSQIGQFMERKQMEARLRVQSAALETATNGVLVADNKGAIQWVNPAFTQLTGYSASEIIGQNLRVLKSGRHEASFYKNLWKTILAGHVWQGELINKRKDGSLYSEEMTVMPVRGTDGRVTHFVAIKQDISARTAAAAQLMETNYHLEAATARANEMAIQAELASSAKSAFLASMSHEIRTPMNGVIGMLGLLQDGELSERQRESAAQIARSSADALLVVINDILDFSKIESGKMTIELVTFDLQTMVEEVGELFAAKVSDKGLDLIIRYAPNMPRHVIGDAGRIRQVLTNLLGNAIKFTAQGHVLISLHCESQTDHQAQLKFSVEDTGIGIAEDKIGRLFEKFMQADALTTRRFGGTGLGLAISKQLTELMGGHMGVASGLGKGSIFSFTLPLALPTEALPVAPARTSLAGVRVLIVDDNEVNRRVLHEQITSWRMRNGGYASGEEALTVLREARAAGDPYHLAILDYQMPGMDGEMLARAIKADHVLRETVLVMLTSMGQPDDRHRIKEAGIFACLVKPVRQSKLWDVLAQAWSAHTKQSPVQLLTRPQPSEPRPGEKKHRKFAARVLVADDNTTNQRVARLMLENLGCRVDVAANGKEAVEMLELLPYDVVFMDCEMPEMDGYEATAEIRRGHAGRRQVPIVAMTAKAIQGDREHCLKSGMDDYISKPVRLEDLEATLGRWFSQSDRDVQAVPEKTPASVLPAPVAPALDPEVTERLRQLAEATDPAVLTEIYDSFLSSTVEYLAAMRQAEQAGDANGLRIAAHSLKGASANIGAPTVAEISHQLEMLGNSQSVAGAAELIGQLAQAFAKVKIEIENQTREETVV